MRTVAARAWLGNLALPITSSSSFSYTTPDAPPRPMGRPRATIPHDSAPNSSPSGRRRRCHHGRPGVRWMSTRAGRTAQPSAEHPRHPARRPALGHARLRRTSARQDAADRPHRQRRREFQERLLHDVAVLAQSRVAIERRLRAQARGHEQLHRVPGGDEQLSEGAPAGGLRHGVRREVPHGRGQRRAAPGVRIFRDPQGPGQVPSVPNSTSTASGAK